MVDFSKAKIGHTLVRTSGFWEVNTIVKSGDETTLHIQNPKTQAKMVLTQGKDKLIRNDKGQIVHDVSAIRKKWHE